MYFLDRTEKWERIKPYNFQYYPKEDFPRHNLEHSPCYTRVRNIRSYVARPSLDVEGFEVQHLVTKMSYSDFLDEDKIEEVYLRELEKHFLGVLGAKHVRALDYQLRTKSPEFPYFSGKLPPRPQPSLMTHVDVTPEAAKKIVQELYKDAADEILKSRFEIITVWKPCRLPVEDWPLAVCDARTVKQEDLVPADIIYPDYVAENCMVHYDENQKWYWLPEHGENEVLVFKAVDSEKPGSWPCPHGAFPLPGQNETTPPRESIDVRLLVMYADMTYPPPPES
ncbi:hypothetical protein V8F06_010150 [Rhypophila decipiens]